MTGGPLDVGRGLEELAWLEEARPVNDRIRWREEEREELNRYRSGEVPGLERLAEILRRYRVSWGSFERVCEEGLRSPRGRWNVGWSVDPVVVVERLDLGLAGLRIGRGLWRRHVAEAAGIRDQDLARLEKGESEEAPSVEGVGRILRALGADWGALEETVRDPFRQLRAYKHRRQVPRSRRKLERGERALILGGRVAPEVVRERFDLVLRALRTGRGLSRARLEQAAGLEPGQVLRMERYRGERPTQSELGRIVAALDVGWEELEEAANNPFQARDGVAGLGRWGEAMVIGGEPVSELVVARFEVALKVLRSRERMSRARLASASGVSEARILALERAAGKGPTDEELERLREALGVRGKDFERAAKDPVRELRRMVKRTRAAARGAEERVRGEVGEELRRPALVERLEREGAAVGWAVERLSRGWEGERS
ncbi:MAG: hypothetical protein ACOC92_00635 [bacterium]